MLPFDDPQLFLSPSYHFAVVEGSNDMLKKGFQIYQLLKSRGFSAAAVNAGETQIQNDISFPAVSAVRPFPDVVILTEVFPIDKIMMILREMRDSGLFRIWAEPGTLPVEAKQFAEENNISVLDSFSLLTILQGMAEKM